MTSTEYTSNPNFSNQSVFKDQKIFYPDKKDSKLFSRNPSYIFLNPLNNFNFNSQFSFKNAPIRERFNSSDFVKIAEENNFLNKSFFPIKNMNKDQSILGFPSLEYSREPSRFHFKNSNLGNAFGKGLKLETNDFLLNLVGQDNEKKIQKRKNFLRENLMINKKIFAK